MELCPDYAPLLIHRRFVFSNISLSFPQPFTSWTGEYLRRSAVPACWGAVVPLSASSEWCPVDLYIIDFLDIPIQYWQIPVLWEITHFSQQFIILSRFWQTKSRVNDNLSRPDERVEPPVFRKNEVFQTSYCRNVSVAAWSEGCPMAYCWEYKRYWDLPRFQTSNYPAYRRFMSLIMSTTYFPIIVPSRPECIQRNHSIGKMLPNSFKWRLQPFQLLFFGNMRGWRAGGISANINNEAPDSKCFSTRLSTSLSENKRLPLKRNRA